MTIPCHCTHQTVGPVTSQNEVTSQGLSILIIIYNSKDASICNKVGPIADGSSWLGPTIHMSRRVSYRAQMHAVRSPWIGPSVHLHGWVPTYTPVWVGLTFFMCGTHNFCPIIHVSMGELTIRSTICKWHVDTGRLIL